MYNVEEIQSVWSEARRQDGQTGRVTWAASGVLLLKVKNHSMHHHCHGFSVTERRARIAGMDIL
jgi:hypothetical protein